MARLLERVQPDTGFTLVEVLVALSLLLVISVGVVWLFVVSIDGGRIARDRTIAAIAAAGKMEQLRSLEWRFELDASGLPTPRTDLVTDVSLDPIAAGGPGLADSPPGTLDADLPPYVDYLDRRGRWVGNGGSPPGSAAYVRRWGIHRLPVDPARVIALEVLVTTISRARTRASSTSSEWNGEDVLLTTMVTRSVR
jgi:prepilin-type N-terminal cleavage/methylation domain-containing protein